VTKPTILGGQPPSVVAVVED